LTDKSNKCIFLTFSKYLTIGLNLS